MSVIVAGIGTDVGKTVVSAILCQALTADYWKPVQAGDLEHTDTDKVRHLANLDAFQVHEERFRLTAPMSPHAAANLDNVVISPEDFIRPDTKGRALVTELAGGLMVPFSDNFLTVDLVAQLGDAVVLVANTYLGSINHTLLSLELLAQRKVPLAGIIFNGESNPESRDVILKHSGAQLLAEIPYTHNLDKAFVKFHADKIQQQSGLARL